MPEEYDDTSAFESEQPSDVQAVPIEPELDPETIIESTEVDPTDVQQVPQDLSLEDPTLEQQVPVRPGQPGYEVQPAEPFTPEETEAFSCCCQEGLPEDWESWEAPVEPSPESWTEQDYSTDWGTVEPTWAEQGEEVFPTVPQEQTVSDLVGPGHEADVYWADQGQTNYCALYSVRAVLSELYGEQANIDEIISRADANGWLVRDEQGVVQGVYSEHVDDIFASYGVPSHFTNGEEGSWQRLNDALANDQRIVLSLDSKEIEAGGNVGDVPGGYDSDHAVAITGIDYERGVVIMNDSARRAGLEMPLDVFYESWRDSDFSMTVTDTSMPAPAEAVVPAGAGAARPDAPGYALLGMTLTPQLRTA